jgi:hypothetical protein
LKDYRQFLKAIRTILKYAASPEEKAKIARLLVHRVEVFPERVKIYYKLGESSLVARPFADAQGDVRDALSTKKADPLGDGSAENFFWLDGSKRLTNGRGDAIENEPLVVIREF